MIVLSADAGGFQIGTDSEANTESAARDDAALRSEIVENAN